MPAHWLHCVRLARLGGSTNMLAQPNGEIGVVTLAADADIGWGESSAHPSILAAKEQVHPSRLYGQV